MLADTFERRSTNLTKTMQTQIVSMLKDVIEDEKNEVVDEGKDLDYSQDRIIFQDEDSEEDESETQSNTIADQTLSQIFYSRGNVQKSQTTKYKNSLSLIPDPSFIPIYPDYERKIKNKFQTQQNPSQIAYLMNTGPKFHNPTSDPNLNRLNATLGCNSSFFSFANQKPSTFANNQIQNNINIAKGYPRMMTMQQPLRTFNFKNSYLNHTQNGYPTQRMSPMLQQYMKSQKLYTDDRMALELETMLVKTNKFDMEIYNYFKGSFISLIKNQQASRLCQFYFDQTPSNIVHLIFTELRDNITQLLLDPYANYFCLKIFYFLNSNDRIAFLENTSGNLDVLSTNKISTYPIQCIVEHLNTDKEKEIVINSINKQLMKLCLDIYGTHVLEKILNCFEYEFVKPIMKFILDNFLFLANNANGLCVIKKEIVCENKKENFEQLKKEIVTHALVLIQNPYGNYALQTAIDNWDLEDCEELMHIFEGKCSVLSLQKYSSNVIERCIEKNPAFLDKFINEILSDNSCAVGLLLQNSFGNYVVQTALKHSYGEKKHNLIIAIEENLSKMNEKKLIMKWRGIIASYSDQNP